VHGSWLPILRTGWVVLSILTLSTFIASLPVYFANEQITYTLGYSAFLLALNIFVTLVWFVVASLIFWRKSNDWLALLVSLMLVTQGVNGIISSLGAIPLVLQVPVQTVNVLAFFLLFLVFSLFPTGRFVPRWMGWLAVPFLALQVVGALNLISSSSSYILFYLLLWYCFLGSLVISQIYRYLSVSSRTERQQAKWIVFGVLATYLIELGFAIYFSFFASSVQTGSLADLLLSPLGNVAPIFIPLSFGFAILRYRLWDIDIIINRTLVYGTLTALLALVYFGSVIGLQSLLRGFTGEGNQIAIVGSTLLIAALFQPLRHYIQNSIDRRFYRYKYDAARTLKTFSVILREEVDLDQLGERLLTVVEETMQPSHVSLWLRTPEWSNARKTRRLPQIDES
jgi:hypothetical protein